MSMPIDCRCALNAATLPNEATFGKSPNFMATISFDYFVLSYFRGAGADRAGGDVGDGVLVGEVGRVHDGNLAPIGSAPSVEMDHSAAMRKTGNGYSFDLDPLAVGE
jgi:hypothetical protein